MSLSLAEPVTFLTDLMITAACLILINLIRKNMPGARSSHPWQWFFGTMAIASFLGGMGHLLFEYVGTNLLLVSWLLSGLAVFLFEKISLSLVADERLRAGLKIFIIGKLIAFGIYSVIYRSFTGVKVHTALGLLFIVLAVHLANFLRSRASGSLWIITGILLTTLAALTHSVRLVMGEKWFNHNDLSHVIVLASLCAIYKGAVRLESGRDLPMQT